jgi:glycosyltransferase involved in cell wall biosynthesis
VYRGNPAPLDPRPSILERDPPVSVVVTHYNLGAYLPQALDSLAAQTHPNLEVIVVDDGSTEPASVQALAEQERRHPTFRFVRQQNAGVGAARNRGLAEGRGEFILFFDADNVALPHMIEALVRGLRRNPELSALTCFSLNFLDGNDPETGPYQSLTTYAGGPHVLASLENVYGDTNALWRAEHLRAIGGYENDRSSPWEDWMTHVKLVNAGHRLDVLPEYLFRYRMRGAGRLGTLQRDAQDTFVLTQGLWARCFRSPAALSASDLDALWTALVSWRADSERSAAIWHELTVLRARLGGLHHRLAERLNHSLRRLPLLHRSVKAVLRLGLRTWRGLRRGG